MSQPAPSGADDGRAQDYRPFGTILRDLLIERDFTTGMGNPNWSNFAHSLRGVHYETLRKAVVQERQPAPKLIQVVARKLQVPPELFAEYRLWKTRNQFDPAEVGLETALDNLARWEAMLEERG
jgi:hypothetical protein